MIPHRVQLSGFLSYKDAQEITFAGSPLWMLTGTNGSGKSSIFDAVTYSLFGHHRGGSQNADELINKESNALAVEFDFHLDSQLFRIKRTLKRNKKGSIAGTQQVFVQTADDWEAVPDTNKKVDFDKWIAAKIGLTYDIFTSSVLLLQGKAEKLLDSKPSGRAEVLAGIVDLDRYQRLYERANAKKLKLKSDRDAYSTQMAGIQEVAPEDFAGALIRIDECERARAEAQESARAGQERVESSRRWAEAEQRSTVAKGKLKQSETLLNEAAAIQTSHQRFTELRQVLPAVEIVVTTRAKSVEATKKTAKFALEKDETLLRKSNAEVSLDGQRRQRTLDKKKLDEHEADYSKLNSQIRTLTGQLQTIRLVEVEESNLKRFAEELQQLPKNPDTDLKTARAEVERLGTLDRVLPILEQLSTERHDLAQFKIAESEARKSVTELKATGAKAKEDAVKTKSELEAARIARGRAESALAVAKAQHQQAKVALTDFQAIQGASSCTACGQPLTPAHFGEELKRRTEAVALAAAAVKTLSAEVKLAQQHEETAMVADATQTERLLTLREAYKIRDAAATQHGRDIDRLTKSLDLRYAEMPNPYQRQIAASPPKDWATSTFPERDELTALRREIAGLDAARRQATTAEEMLKKINDLRTRLDAAQQSRERLKANLPDADLVALRQEFATAQSRDTVLTNQIKGGKTALETLDRAIDKLGTDAANEAQYLTELTGKLNAEKLSLQYCADTIEKWLRNLPASWLEPAQKAGLEHYSQWKSELDDLIEAKTETRFQQLEQSRHGLDTLRLEVERLAAEAEAFPVDVHRPVAELQTAVKVAQQEFDRCDAALQTAHKAKLKLDGYLESRVKLELQHKEADGQFARYKTLSELLGRDRLQRHLVRQAERQIVEYGNAVLDRLSSGQLYLKLASSDDGSADKALDLDCFNRTTGGEPINVLFLSGSQKFRVAVSLALAIGQYASRQHRPIESVIIDEGFGCLDRNGRQVMIQELQNLRGQLKCILLVSHQEEFAEAFADGYRFELKEGATVVSRFQR